MSAPTEPAASHAADDDDDEPESELLPDEPHTPMWLPLLGGVLALLAILAFLMTRPPGKTAEQLSQKASPASSAAASASAAPSATAPMPAPAPVPHPAP